MVLPPFFDRHETMIVISTLAKIIAVALDVVSFAMLVRVILSLFPSMQETRFMVFLLCITEPFIAPVRFLLNKFNLFQGTPIDWSFTVTYLIIAILRTALPTII